MRPTLLSIRTAVTGFLLALTLLAIGISTWPGPTNAAPTTVLASARPYHPSSASSCPSPSFGTATNYPVGGFPLSVAVGDFNRDGNSDFVSANLDSNNITISLGNGSGGFGSATGFTVGTGPNSVAVGDFNRDGSADLVTTNFYSGTASVLLGNGSGAFGSATDFAVGGFPLSAAVADFNVDGNPDIVAVSGADNVALLIGNGSGGFASATYFGVGPSPQSVAVGDFNRDGNPDMATANLNGNSVSILLGDGNGGFGSENHYGAGVTPVSIAVGDFNMDGKPDLVTSTHANTASVLLGNGNGTFSAATNYATGSRPDAVKVGDFNRDGNPDLVTANYDADTLSVLLGNGNGSFGAATNFGAAAGINPQSVAVGDFNRDGNPDLVATNSGSNNSSVFLNTCAVSCGSPSFGSATDFNVGDDPRSVAVGDFNRDGISDLVTANIAASDVSVLLGNSNGSFGTFVNYAAGLHPSAVAAGDFNNNGILDLAVANYSSNNVSILLGAGNGSFGAPSNYAVQTSPNSIAVGDFNKDGNLDLAVANSNVSNSVSVLLGNGDGTFGTATNFATGPSPWSLTAGDFNKNGNLDLAVANTGSDNVSILLGNGSGSFSAATNFGVDVGPGSIEAGDFNRDGNLDLVTANPSEDNVSVLLGNGSGGFGAVTNFSVGFHPVSVTVGDFNRDGILDLSALNNRPAGTASVLQGNGSGGFSAATNFGVGMYPNGIAAGDFNRDSSTDLVIANSGSSTVSILMNTCGVSPPTLTPTSTLTNIPTQTNTSTGTPTVTATGTPPTPTRTRTPDPCVEPSPGPWQVTAPRDIDAFAPFMASNGTESFIGGGWSWTGIGDIIEFSSYNPVTNVWHSLTNIPDGTNSLAAAEYDPVHNRVYVFGGEEFEFSDVVDLCRQYDVSTNTWTACASLPDIRASMAHGYYNGKVYLVGGYTSGSFSTATKQVWEYDIAANTYLTKTSVPVGAGFGGAGSAVIGSNLYVMGGRNSNDTNVDTLWIYNMATDTWSSGANLPFANNVPSAAALNGKIYMFGGGNPWRSSVPGASKALQSTSSDVPNATDATRIYDPVTDSWSTGFNLNLSRSLAAGGSVGPYLVVSGGKVPDGPATTWTEIAYAPPGLCPSPTIIATPTATNTTVPNTPTSTLTSTSINTPISTNTPAPPAPTACPIQFTDVPYGSTFYTYVRCLACRNIVGGYTDPGRCTSGAPCFLPGDNVTRGQLSKIVSNAVGFSDPQPSQLFQDVPVGSTFQVFIGRLASRGFVGGYSCGGAGEPCVPPDNRPYFRPNNNATRGQISKIVSNAAGFAEPHSEQTFQDVPVGSTFYDFIERLASRGVMSGYQCGGAGEPCVPPDNRPYFRPNNNATRGQTSKIVANTFLPSCETPVR